MPSFVKVWRAAGAALPSFVKHGGGGGGGGGATVGAAAVHRSHISLIYD